MDVSRYQFGCQKALHMGLQYARSLGHQLLEVEHVALALLRADAVALGGQISERLKRYLDNHLTRAPKIYGSLKINFGRRLDTALDGAELAAGAGLVSEKILWEALVRQSTVIQTFLSKIEGEFAADTPPKIDQKSKRRSVTEDPVRPAAGGRPNSGESYAGSGNVPEKIEKDLRQFTVDLSAAAERGELDPVIGRDAEVRRVLEILGRKKKNNPLLIGEPGVGKSAVAEAIALRISEGSVPESMKDKRVLTLDLGSMLAGAKYRGEFEERMKNLLKAMEALKGKVILFIDEIHMLVGAGNHEGGADAANLLKPALARGELQCLGATTLEEYRKYIERDSALERRFQPVIVEEPSKNAAVAILRGIKSRYEIHHGVQIDDAALVAAVNLSVKYLSGRKLPDKAIDLMDEAASRLRLQVDSVPAVLDTLRAEINQIEIERKAVGSGDERFRAKELVLLDVRLEQAKREYGAIEKIWRDHQSLLERMKVVEKNRQEASALLENTKTQGDFAFAARIQYGEMPDLDKELQFIKSGLARMQDEHDFLRQVVGPREIAEVVSQWTRIPVGKLVEDDRRKLMDLENTLARRVFGQSAAIKTIARSLRRARTGVKDPGRPIGVFLFLGPTGVGKTEMAKCLAAEMFSDENRMIRVDMSEYMEAHSVARLVGSPPGYVGFAEGGDFIESVRQQPYSVILFDEVEKAHPRVLDILLQVFDDGRLTSGQGKVADFKNTLIIMTSNLTVNTVLDPELATDQDIRDSLTQSLRPEFVNRIDEVIHFNRLGVVQFQALLGKMLADLNDRLADRLFKVSLGSKVAGKIIEAGMASGFGGRAARRAFETLVIDAVSDRLLMVPEYATGAWTLELDPDDQVVWVPEDRPNFYLPPSGT